MGQGMSLLMGRVHLRLLQLVTYAFCKWNKFEQNWCVLTFDFILGGPYRLSHV